MSAAAGDDRQTRLVVRLGELVSRGAEVLEHRPPAAAVVRRRIVPSLTPSIVVSLLATAGFLLLHDPLFLPAALVGLATWIAKSRHPGEEQVLLVRAHEDGTLTEHELGTA